MTSDLPARDEVNELVGTTLGRFRLVRVLGRGGMGAVYEGEDDEGGRVAVKVVLETDRRKPELLRRFVREWRTTTAIDDPHVVRVLEIASDEARGVPYLVMELLRGTDLQRVLREEAALAPDVVARLFVDLCHGLAAAHARGVIHRDIKPANVFLHCAEGDTVVPKICDFGIAKNVRGESDVESASTELTRTGGLLGSPPYMSPEQAKNSKEVDRRSDVWSLGVALYEALAGRRPFRCDSVVELMVAIITQPIPPLQEVAPWIDAALAEVVHRALERDPAKRHPSMESFAEALEPFAIAGPLTLASFAPIDDRARSVVAARPKTTSTSSSGSMGGASHDLGRPRRPERPRGQALLLVAGSVVLAMMIGLSLFLRGASDGATTAGSTSSTVAATSTPSPTTKPTNAPSAPVPSSPPPPSTVSATASATVSAKASAPSPKLLLAKPPTPAPSQKLSAAPPPTATWTGPTGVSTF